jgi:acyl-CoA thioesterase FadM
MKWLSAVMHELGGAERVRAMLKGQGVSFILKSISLQYRRPVTYPDTVCHTFLIALPSYN